MPVNAKKYHLRTSTFAWRWYSSFPVGPSACQYICNGYILLYICVYFVNFSCTFSSEFLFSRNSHAVRETGRAKGADCRKSSQLLFPMYGRGCECGFSIAEPLPIFNRTYWKAGGLLLESNRTAIREPRSGAICGGLWRKPRIFVDRYVRMI